MAGGDAAATGGRCFDTILRMLGSPGALCGLHCEAFLQAAYEQSLEMHLRYPLQRAHSPVPGGSKTGQITRYKNQTDHDLATAP